MRLLIEERNPDTGEYDDGAGWCSTIPQYMRHLLRKVFRIKPPEIVYGPPVVPDDFVQKNYRSPSWLDNPDRIRMDGHFDDMDWDALGEWFDKEFEVHEKRTPVTSKCIDNYIYYFNEAGETVGWMSTEVHIALLSRYERIRQDSQTDTKGEVTPD